MYSHGTAEEEPSFSHALIWEECAVLTVYKRLKRVISDLFCLSRHMLRSHTEGFSQAVSTFTSYSAETAMYGTTAMNSGVHRLFWGQGRRDKKHTHAVCSHHWRGQFSMRFGSQEGSEGWKGGVIHFFNTRGQRFCFFFFCGEKHD